MNFNEAQEILKRSGYRVINEMAKAARNRILDRLTPKKKAIYVLGRFMERGAEGATLKDLEKYVTAKQPVTNLSWADFKTELNIDAQIPRNRVNPHIANTGIVNVAEQNAAMYQSIVNTIERSKDDVDRNYVDAIYNYYKATKEGTAPATAYEQFNVEPAIEWLKQNEAEAEERFGHHWASIKKSLRRYWDENFNGTDEQAFDLFLDWYRAKKNHQELPTLSNEIKDKLVRIAMTDGAEQTFGNYVWTLRRTATEWLGQSLEEYQAAHPTGTQYSVSYSRYITAANEDDAKLEFFNTYLSDEASLDDVDCIEV